MNEESFTLASKYSTSFCQICPSELIRIILSYFAKTWKDLILFGSICSSWKYEADHCFIWLEYPLKFYCPEKYFRLRTSSYASNISRTQYGDMDPLRIYLKENEEFSLKKFPADKYKIIFSYKRRNSEEFLEDDKNFNYQDALLCRQNFMNIFVQYHRLWFLYSSRFEFLLHWKDEGAYWKTCLSSIYCKVLSILLLAVAAYLLSDIPADRDGSLSTANQIGFACLYLPIAYRLPKFILEIPDSLFTASQYPKRSNLLTGVSVFHHLQRAARNFGYFSFNIGILLFIIVYHVSRNDSSISLLDVSIPLWIGAGISFFCLMDFAYVEFSYFGEFVFCITAIIIIFCIPIAYTLAAVYYTNQNDDNEKNSFPLWASVIPFFPPAVGFFLLWIAEFSKAIQLSHKYIYSVERGPINEQENDRQKKLICLIAKIVNVFVLSACQMIFIFWVIQVFWQEHSPKKILHHNLLAVTIVSLILIFLCWEILFVAGRYDTETL